MQAFNFCGRRWEERYGNNLEPRGDRPALDFGTRMHQLLEVRHRGSMQLEVLPMVADFPPLPDIGLESEAQLTFAAYEAHYPTEPFDVVSVEEYFEVPVGRCKNCAFWGEKGKWEAREPCECHYNSPSYNHTYCGEFDAIVRMRESGRLRLFETKTEARNSKANLPASWQQKTQVSLYLFAAQQIYGEEFEGILLNVITRQSPAGREPPIFRRDLLERTRGQQTEAIKNLVWIADNIEACKKADFFPANRNECIGRYGFSCEYLFLHQNEGRPTEELIQLKFQTAKEYLSGF